MKDLAPYLYPLLLAAFGLLSYIMQRIARWQKRQSAQEQEASQPAADEAQQALEELNRKREQLRQQRDQQQRTRQPRKEQQRVREQSAPLPAGPPTQRVRRPLKVLGEEEPLEVRLARARANRPDVSGLQLHAPHAPRATRVRALLADRRSLRQAFVLTAVLGPCLAQESSAHGGMRPEA